MPTSALGVIMLILVIGTEMGTGNRLAHHLRRSVLGIFFSSIDLFSPARSF